MKIEVMQRLMEIEDELDSLWRQEEHIQNRCDETFYENELKQIRDEISDLKDEQGKLWKLWKQ